jgi:hypothetical protein
LNGSGTVSGESEPYTLSLNLMMERCTTSATEVSVMSSSGPRPGPKCTKRSAATLVEVDTDDSDSTVKRRKRTDTDYESSKVCLSLDDVCAGSLILEQVLSHLDIPSLKRCRRVCKTWDEEGARKLLMKERYLNIESFLKACGTDEELYSRVGLYSSWKVNFDYVKLSPRKKELQDWGKVVKSLYLSELFLDSQCISLVRNMLSKWFPNVVEVRLGFKDHRCQPTNLKTNYKELDEFRRSLESQESREEFQSLLAANKNHTFQPFPTLSNVKTVRLEKKCGVMASHFGFNLVTSCPNLRHLFLLELEPSPWELKLNSSAFGILKYLANRPDITGKLETFEWQVATGHGQECFVPELNFYNEKDRQPVQFVTGNEELPCMQFGENLKVLRWDVLHVDVKGKILPGVLPEKVARNLRKLSTRKAALDPREFPPVDSHNDRAWILRGIFDPKPLQILSIDFPQMPKLSVIEIGIRTCYTISLSDLVDAAPNLMSLEITGCECCDILGNSDRNTIRGIGPPTDDIWEGFNSSSALEKHTNLKILKAGISMRNDDILQKTVDKFPNLEELWIGQESGYRTKLRLHSILDTLENLKLLKRFKWTYSGPVDLAKLIVHLVDAGRRAVPMESYHLRFFKDSIRRGVPLVDIKGYVERKNELLKMIRTRTAASSCRLLVAWWDKNVFDTKVRNLDSSVPGDARILAFREVLSVIEKHKLPIQFELSTKGK